MSGGSYDYAYRKIEDLDRWPETLNHMARQCRAWSVSERASKKYVDGAYAPTTLEDRARVLVRAELLARAAVRLQRAIDEVKQLEVIMHDVEWVESGDYGVDALMKPLAEEEKP